MLPLEAGEKLRSSAAVEPEPAEEGSSPADMPPDTQAVNCGKTSFLHNNSPNYDADSPEFRHRKAESQRPQRDCPPRTPKPGRPIARTAKPNTGTATRDTPSRTTRNPPLGWPNRNDRPPEPQHPKPDARLAKPQRPARTEVPEARRPTGQTATTGTRSDARIATQEPRHPPPRQAELPHGTPEPQRRTPTQNLKPATRRADYAAEPAGSITADIDPLDLCSRQSGPYE